MAEHPHVVVLCGGVGAARFLRGLVQLLPHHHITAIVNIADDFTLHGLHVSPDLDTVTYTLADAIDPERGWGLVDETWTAMQALARYGDGDWFSLGDNDLGTHLHRTQRLSEGASLTEVTIEITKAWDVGVRILPVSDDPVATYVTLADSGEEISFQRYFVGKQHAVPISAVRFDGVESAQPSPEVRSALESADVIVLAPSNPIVSIKPVLAIPGIRDALAQIAAPVVAVSPLVGGAALKGPAAAMMSELGHRPDAVGVATMFRDLVDVLVIDDQDAGSAAEVAVAGCTPLVTNTIMSSPAASAALARACLSAAALGVRTGSQS
ncbi:MAG: 2-phospho-L-lactate transferase [Acidimicrobiales bacterium]|nr:2-phospho-L-lactate transferase [Acidimicrobiales bacterium]RZV48646.1 MAG: 2-phospho-L-lactate transferase [Acidimicrobiales bacterium]